ncbi:MAG: hypothetical protein AAB566_00105, partial [Patescibacteria group bacterium]
LPLTCSPVFRQVNIGEFINYTAAGGQTPYSWSAGSFANPSTGSGGNFATAFATSGFKTVNLISGDGQSVGCPVLVSEVSVTPTPTPTPGFVSISVNKLARNLTQGGGEFDSISARPNETVEFVINIFTSGNTSTNDIRIFDSLPSGLRYVNGSTRIDGSFAGDGVTFGSGLFVGSFGSGRTITVRFQAVVENDSFFNFSTTSLVNRATVTSGNAAGVTDTALVNVSRTTTVIDSGTYSIQKLGRNITRGEAAEQGSIVANPNDTIEFIIRVRSLTNTTLFNVTVRDFLPNGLVYQNRTTSADNIVISDGIAGGGINLGTLNPFQEKIVRFSARVGGNESFGLGTTSLSNTIQVSADNASTLSAQIPVSVFKGKGISAAGQVATGSETIIISALISALLAYTLVIYGRTYFAQKRGVLGVIRKHANDPNKFNFV